MIRRAAAAILAAVVLISAFAVLPFSAYAAEPAVSSSDAGYFDRVSVVPMNVEVPEFYQQVTTVAGMYIFTTPDGVIHKRIYGSLNGVFGWYVPEGTANEVPIDAQQIDIQEDIRAYNEAVEAAGKVTESSSYIGILPPEHGTYGMKTVFGMPIGTILFCSFAAVLVLCLAIVITQGARSAKRKRQTGAADNKK